MIKPIEINVLLDGVVIESFWTTTTMDQKDFESIARKIPAVKRALKKKINVTASIYADAVVFFSKEYIKNS